MRFQVIGIRVDQVIQWEESIVGILLLALEREGLQIENGDIIVITSKVVSMEQRSSVTLADIVPGDQARELSKLAHLPPEVIQAVVDECNGEVIGAVHGAILTKTPYGLLPNAGLDLSNVPEGYALLLPRNPDRVAQDYQEQIKRITGKQVCVIISDSNIMPLRRGTFSIAIGTAGIRPVHDVRGTRDLFGRELRITTRALADNLATAANMAMGEAAERTPFALIRGLDLVTAESHSNSEMLMPEDQCLFYGPLVHQRREKEL